MNAEIRKLYSLEIEDAMTAYWPSEVDNFGTWIRLSVGPSGQAGTDNFDLFVCTPKWLFEQLEKDSAARWGRHLLIVREYDLTVISKRLAQLVQQSSGLDWQTIALKISRFAAWEFEDYKM